MLFANILMLVVLLFACMLSEVMKKSKLYHLQYSFVPFARQTYHLQGNLNYCNTLSYFYHIASFDKYNLTNHNGHKIVLDYQRSQTDRK